MTPEGGGLEKFKFPFPKNGWGYSYFFRFQALKFFRGVWKRKSCFSLMKLHTLTCWERKVDVPRKSSKTGTKIPGNL